MGWTLKTVPSSPLGAPHDHQLHHLPSTPAAIARSASTASHRLSGKDVDDIDHWLERLERLEGALPPKVTFAPAGNRPRATSIATAVSNSTSQACSPVSTAHTHARLSQDLSASSYRRRSLGVFGGDDHLRQSSSFTTCAERLSATFPTPPDCPASLHKPHDSAEASSGNFAPWPSINEALNADSEGRESAHIGVPRESESAGPERAVAKNFHSLAPRATLRRRPSLSIIVPHSSGFTNPAYAGVQLGLVELGLGGDSQSQANVQVSRPLFSPTSAYLNNSYASTPASIPSDPAEAMEGTEQSLDATGGADLDIQARKTQIVGPICPRDRKQSSALGTDSSARSMASVSRNASSAHQAPSSSGRNVHAETDSHRLTPRSPFSSPKATLSSLSSRTGMRRKAPDSSSLEPEVEASSSGGLRIEQNPPLAYGDIDAAVDALQSTGHSDSASSPIANFVTNSGALIDDALHLPGPPGVRSLRLKNSSKSSFASSVDSVNTGAGTSVHSTSASVPVSLGHARKESTDSRASSAQSKSNTQSHYHSLFSRNARKPARTAEASQDASFDVETKNADRSHKASRPDDRTHVPRSALPRLVARDERVLYRQRPRLTSARSASSLNLEEHAASNDARNGISNINVEGSSDSDDTDLLNPRRASISSTTLAHHRSRDDRRALAASINRVSLAIPPPLVRSYSHDGQVRQAQGPIHAASAEEVPELKQSVLLWLTDELSDPSRYVYDRTTHAGSATPRPSHNPTTSHSLDVGALASALLSNVPNPMRKKVTRRGSTQILFSEIAPAGSVTSIADIGPLEEPGDVGKKSKPKGNNSKDQKDRPPILLPSGRWQPCEATLKSTGQLLLRDETSQVLHAAVAVTTLLRTDMRLVDPSLLGIQRCIGLSVRNKATSWVFDSGETAPPLPMSPSAPDLKGPAGPPENWSTEHSEACRSQTIYIALPSAASQHAWMASLLCHAQAEIYPPSAVLGRMGSVPVEEEGQSDHSESSSLPLSMSPDLKASWRIADGDAYPLSDTPIRMYRSVALQIIQARSSSDGRVSQASQSSGSAAGLGGPLSPSSLEGPLAPATIPMYRRTDSIASGSIKSADGFSDDGNSQNSKKLRDVHFLRGEKDAADSLHAKNSPTAAQPTLLKKTDGAREKARVEEKQVFCEIWLDGEVLGRTGVKKFGASGIWEEIFHFSNLGPLRKPLVMHIYSIRKSQVTAIGRVTLPLPSMKRNTTLEGWFPIEAPSRLVRSGHLESLGELNLTVLVKEDVAMPYKTYSKLSQLLSNDHDSSALVSLLATFSIDLDQFSQTLLRIDMAHRRVLHRMMALCTMEVRHKHTNVGTLFRGTTLLTKTLEMYMRLVGQDYLDSAIGGILRKICSGRVSLEIDPDRLESRENLADNIRELERWASAIWQAVYNSRQRCPADLRKIFRKIQQIVDQYCADEEAAGRVSTEERHRAHVTSVSAFVSLRLFGPAILRPNLFRLSPTHPPDVKTSRTLVLIAKTINGLANMQPFGGKEPWMTAMNPFLHENLPSYQDFIAHLCSKTDGAPGDWTDKEFGLYRTPNSLRAGLQPAIAQEGVPEVPFLIDLPKEYAALASIVTQACRKEARQGYDGNNKTDSHQDANYSEIATECQKIHGQARARIRTLERTGEFQSLFRSSGTSKPLARSEQARLLGSRSRGATVSRATFGKSARSAVNNSQASMDSETELSRDLAASSPASNTARMALNADLSSSTLGNSNLSDDMELSRRSKRRSHTVSVTASGDRSGLGSLSSPPRGLLFAEQSLPQAPASLDSHAPGSTLLSTSKSLDGQRKARPPPLSSSVPLDSNLHRSTPPEAKTPRAPTFSREQDQSLRDIQAHLKAIAVTQTFSEGSTPMSPTEQSQTVASPTRMRLFRRK